jgi:UDP-glucose 4-epimerase
MRVLLTGASSFTGYWFVRELLSAGHDVTAILRGRLHDATNELRDRRAAGVSTLCRTFTECSFGDERFLDVINTSGPWDVMCHHAAEVKGYRSPTFDAMAALASNVRNIENVAASLARAGCQRVILTGSIFEPDEGAGSEGLPAFSPYGLSKGLTAQVFRYYIRANRMSFGKFVISNPFGPYEEKRFTTYLASTWLSGGTPEVLTPAYVRDNIHVGLLARVYRQFVEQGDNQTGLTRMNPSGYVETQGAFAQRCAVELSPRLGVSCGLNLARQESFSEPRVRINTDSAEITAVGWDEARAWDDLAAFYLQYCSQHR